MADVGGQHVISREFSNNVQLYNAHAVCDFTARAWIRLRYRHCNFLHKFIALFSLNTVTSNLIIRKL